MTNKNHDNRQNYDRKNHNDPAGTTGSELVGNAMNFESVPVSTREEADVDAYPNEPQKENFPQHKIPSDIGDDTFGNGIDNMGSDKLPEGLEVEEDKGAKDIKTQDY